ncbi:secretory carrier membrane protein 4 [Strigomonas culicis]|uniref:Secretory carrier membrane protein 4 n=1 Tax=Strigomonas culicis TaxID=28005 RepID=S9UXC3_9TRYP|nr:secretory carrier membrane protein 4 [Strigomonas culicis]EPY35537.1 secretory carrier membrane protein 4 [Strigomonas culicis]|eukprot:EPY23709.1 secretory carrier membrane protein 4 [Strigomonas culicis]
MPIMITEEMVLAKERENSTRFKELTARQKEIPSALEPEPNFPPECCCIKPIIYHNIREQVPVPQQRFMYALCGLYMTLIGLILYNIIAALVTLFFGGAVIHFGLSFLYLLGLPGAWIVWYFNVYSSVVKLSRIRQVFSILGLFLAFAFDAWMAIGINGLGGCGWLITISAVKNLPCFIVLIIAAILWTLHGVAMFIMMGVFWKTSNVDLRSKQNAAAFNTHTVML